MIALIRELIHFSGRHANRIRISFLFSFLRSFCGKVPYIVAIVLIALLAEDRVGAAHCVIAAGILLLFFVLHAVLTSFADRFQGTAGYEMMAEKRMELGAHLRRLPMGYFTEGNIGKISTILSSDMVFVEENCMQVIGECVSDIFAQWVLTAMFFALHPLLGAVLLFFEIAAVLVAAPMRRTMRICSDKRQDALEELNSAVIEYASGIGVVKSYNRMGESSAELRSGFAGMTDANLDLEAHVTPWQRALSAVYGLGVASILAAAVYLYERGNLGTAPFIGITLMSFGAFASLQHFYLQGMVFIIMKSGLNKLRDVMREPELPDGGTAVLGAASEDVPEIEFQNVTFSYGGGTVLRDISFAVKRGETVALVGASGSGKTTIANLLARFWDISEGTIRLRGADIRDLPLDTLMEQISMVFQKVYLFEDTLRNNIAMGKTGADDEEILEAARKSRCSEFISKFPYGLDTYIGAGGATLSGGEAQRVSIARCILKDAPIVILDEATASIDADNESQIQAALSNLCRGKTTLVIAHRLNTIRNADRIVLLDQGRIVETGNHDQLVAKNGAYLRMLRAGGANHE